MFEAKPPAIPFAPLHADDGFSDEELTMFSWGDLVARLSAAQELRAALAHVPATARASFDDMVAGHLAARRAHAVYDREPAVNPVASGNGKCSNATDGSGADRAWPPVRGIA